MITTQPTGPTVQRALAVRAMAREVANLYAQLVQAQVVVRDLSVQIRQLRTLLGQGSLSHHRHTHPRPSNPVVLDKHPGEPDLLRRRREALGLAQSAVAHVCGFSRGSVADAETGRRRSVALVAAVQKALDALEAAP